MVATVAKILPTVTITPIDSTFNIDVNAGTFGLEADDTIFGDGYKIYNGTDFGIYCVDCEFTATIRVVGTLTYKLGLGVSELLLTLP